jgi:osmotically-inducible protein OsmY
MPAASDLLHKLRVKVGLLSDERVSGLDVNVDVDNGVARLTGTVSSEEEKAVAEEIASLVEGVFEVENEIVVSPDKETPEETLADALPGTPIVIPGMIGPAAAPPSYGGIAPGVTTVGPPPEAMEELGRDEAIADKVRDAISHDGRIRSRDVDVNVVEGVVHLRGKVDSFEEFSVIDEIASGVPGVKHLRNELEIEEGDHGGCCEW